MAIVFTGGKLIENHLDISADLHTLQINYAAEMLDATTFGATTRKHQGGLKDASIEVQGYANLESSQSDPVLFARIGNAPRLVTAWTKPITAGSTSETGVGMNAVGEGLTWGGQVGTLLPFSFNVQSESDLVRTITMDDALSGGWSTDNRSISLDMVHCSTEERLYAGLHVTALSTALGSTVVATIKSASSSGFTTSNTRVSFTANTCKGGQFVTPIVSSALSTDQRFWRTFIQLSTGSACGGTASGLVWIGLQ